MSCPFMPSVIVACIGDIKMPHEFSKIAEGCLDKQMKMVLHNYITEYLDIINLS